MATPTLNASVGVFNGSWSTVNNGLKWTQSLAIALMVILRVLTLLV